MKNTSPILQITEQMIMNKRQQLRKEQLRIQKEAEEQQLRIQKEIEDYDEEMRKKYEEECENVKEKLKKIIKIDEKETKNQKISNIAENYYNTLQKE